ncbi:uncharacterized protein Z518_06775 [Rhinocladiella mackenziei CBS 650.93]|uniref:Zn(2)-C6 fungal-type domain-containing protein n=1 Tax=Rhinocladiella mackenziei CBS 650.93 TaxID=1442369 RepID=A0A0D2GYC7_9EURO|nr:uncharacterized protein Z518_06775 [Rhinocladiella mackenziei CBS 650.93]KIX03223.1 hypothetical protein Z518_06775 [Rhinocladiella mackenziei CBS 650.93]
MIRIGTEKVRTGCITCKRRRVKCDEGRPRCHRCTKAGRLCEGYANSPRSGSEPVKFVVYSPHNQIPTEHPDLDWFERRALEFFQDRTALELAGAFQTDFWLVNILPLALQENSVKHALIALTSMHEHYSGLDHYSPTRGVDFALSHYGKAMREIVRINQSQLGKSFDYTLVTCSLFSAFESLQGNYHAACNHAISGIKILAEEQRNLVSTGPVRVPRDVLTRFFVQMARQIMELGDPNFQGQRPRLQQKTTPIPDHFISYEDALVHFETLLSDVFEFADQFDNLISAGPVPDDILQPLMADFSTIKANFGKWRAVFDSTLSPNSDLTETSTPESTTSSLEAGGGGPASSSSRPRSPAFLILKIYHALMEAFLMRVEQNDEAVLDRYVSDFWTAINAAEEFIQQTSSFVSPVPSPSYTPPPILQRTDLSSATPADPPPRVIRPTFSLSLGIVPTLFLIATRTTDLAVREKALGLLKSCNRREGFWDAKLAARLAERIFELKDLGNFKYCDSLGNVEFKLLDINFLPGRKCIFRYKFAKMGAAGTELNREYCESLEWEA